MINRIELVEKVLSGQIAPQQAVLKLKMVIEVSNQEFNPEEALMTRMSIRLINRYSQHCQQIASDMDLMASIRDFVCFVGRFIVNDYIRSMITELVFNPFGLYLDGDNHVNVRLAWPDWLPNPGFIESAYAKQKACDRYDQRSPGDYFLSNATPFKGYKSFEQKIGVHTGLSLPSSYTMVLSLPTGAGKSLLLQMIAAYRWGLTLVIVPTVALALDEYRAAKEVLGDFFDIDSISYYHGQVGTKEAKKLVEKLSQGKLRLLFTSPEAVMKNNVLRSALLQAADNGLLSNLVIDEAHIVTDWGSLFRTDFQFLSVFRREILERTSGLLRTFLLSATLTEDTIHILKNLFSEKGSWVELRCDELRPEPRYQLLRCVNETEKRERVMTLCKILPRPLILYVLSPSEAERLYKELSDEGFRNIAVFTGDTEDYLRERIINGWSNDEYDFVIATSAFGMGVDKPDVRTILHACMPESLNRFYQEVGRGGRDGLASISLLCVNMHPQGDRKAAFSLVNKRVISVDKLVGRWKSMCNDQTACYEGDIASFDTSVAPEYLDEDKKDSTGRRNIQWNLNVLLFLCRYGYIELLDVEYEAVRQSYRIKVKLKALKPLFEPEKLIAEFERYRQIELIKVLEGYRIMENIINKGNSKCWGEIFTRLFEYTDELCGGCPTHEKPLLPAPTYHIRKRVTSVEWSFMQENQLKLLMGSFLDMWICQSKPHVIDWREMAAVAQCVNNYGLPVWVVPEEPPVDAVQEFKGLVLTSDEFFYVLERHPSLMRRGIFCAMGNNDSLNQHLFDKAWELVGNHIPVVFYGENNMFLSSQNKTTRNLIEGYIRYCDDILGGMGSVC